ncbi:hypothetical protein [Treponema berlinense]|uniref:hypothetical protein n=1 Tax=Treponema berlinense TaxID=225004 RepID=UPI002352E9A6|nr:hypothetical protein [Treponema berlinense]
MNSVFFKKDFYLRFADGKICGFGGIKIFLSVTALLFFATFFCVATDYKWKGSSSGSWGYAGNWSIIAENGTESPASDWPRTGDCAKFDSEVTITDSVSAGKIVAESGLVFNSDLSTAEIEIKGGNLSVGGNFSWSGNVSVSGNVEVSGNGFASKADLTSGGNIHFGKKYEGTNPSNIECAGEFRISGTGIADGDDSFLLRGNLSAKSIVIEGNKKTSFLGGCSSIITTETQTYGGNVLVNSDITIECSSVTFGGNLVSHTKDSKKDVTITGDCVFKGTVGSEVSDWNNEKIKNLSVSGSVTAYGDFYTSGTLTFGKEVFLAADDIVFSSENNISFKGDIKGNASGKGTVYFGGRTVTACAIEIGGSVTDVNNVVFNGNVVLNSSSNVSAKNDIVFNSDAVLNSSVSAEKDIHFNGGADSVKIGWWTALSSESGSIYFGSKASPVKVNLSNSSGTISVNTKNSGKTFFYGGFYDGFGLSVSGNAEIYGDNVFSGEVKLENCGIVEFYGNNTFSQKFFVKAETLASIVKFKNGSYQSFSSMELQGSSSANTVTLSVLDSSSEEKWYAVFSEKPVSENFKYSIIDKSVSVVSVGSPKEKLLGLIPSDKTVKDSNPHSPTSETWFSYKYFWLGISDSNWANPANWAYDEEGKYSAFVCPSSDGGKSEVVIAKGNSSLSSPYILTLENNVNLKSLTVNKDAEMDLQNFSVTCAENFTNNGTLRLNGGEGQKISATMVNGPDSTVEYYENFSDFVWDGSGTDYFEYENLKITGSGKISQKIRVSKEVFVETSGDLSFLGQNDFNGTVALLEAGNVVIDGDSDGFSLAGGAKCKTLNVKCPVKLNGDVTTTETKTFEGIDCGQFYEKSVFVASNAVLTDKKAVYVKGGLSSQNKKLTIDANAFCESAIDGFLKLEITKTLKVEGNVGSTKPLGTISVLEDAIFSSAEPVQKVISLGNQKYSGKVTARTGLEIKAGADGTNVSSVEFSGFYVAGSLSVTADSAKLFCADYISSGNQVFNCSGGVKILSEKTGISGTWQSENGKIELNETALILDFSDGSLENSFELKSELEAKDVFFYSGKLSVASGKTLKTGNFAAWGKKYSKNDSRFSAEENLRFAYFWDDTDSSILKYKESGNGAELSVNGAIFEVSKSFYANGLDIEGLELKIPDNSSSNPQFNPSSEVTKNQWGIPYAVAFNSKITKTTVEGGWLAAGADSQNCEDGLQNSNVQFFVPKIKKAYSVYDDVIFVEFDLPLENSNGEISKNIAGLKYSNGSETFEGVYSDSDCTKKLTAADGDVSSFYLKGQNSWNTDATGTLSCSPALKSLVDSTDRKGVRKNLTTDLSFLEGIFTSADGHTMCENYGAGNKNGSVPERYTQTEDRASPVLIAVYTGQELHTNAKASAQKSYDSHNFIEFRYSEAVNIAFDDGTILQSEGGDSNIRATKKIGKTTGSGTQDENGNGLIVNGFASIENGKLLAFSKDDTDSPHALYRLFSTKAGEEDSIQTHRVRLSIAGWTNGTVSFSDSLNPSFNGEYLYWPGCIQKAETPAGIVYSLENSAISDLSGNIIDSKGTETNHKLQVLTVNNYSSDGEKDVSKTDSLYGEWDVLCPVVAPVIKSETSWNSWALGEYAADSYEILGTSNTPSDTTLKFIEMHFFDNDKTQAQKWNSWWRTRKGWNEDGKLPENRGGARPDDSYSNSKTLGGIRLCSLKNANSNFSYKIKKSDDSETESETGEFSFEKETDISPVVYGNIFKEQHTKTQADGLYIRLPLSDKTLALRTTFEVYYSPQDSYITDLAGNLLSSSYTQKTKFTSLDVTPPSIVMTLAPIGENKIYAIFSKQLAFGSENRFFKNLSEADLNEALSQIKESFILVKKGSSAGASAEENAITKAEYVSSSDEYTALLFTLEKTINLSDVENLWLRNVGYNSQKVEDGVGITVADTKIRDFLGNYMTQNSGHALSDFAVNALDVLYAYANPKDDDDWNEKGIYGQNTASVSSDYAVHDFTAEQGNYGALVEQRDIALQIKINGEMESERRFLLVPSKSSALSSEMVSDKINLLLGTDWRVWLPTSLKAVATHPNSSVMSENFPESADGGNGILWNYTLKNEDYGFKSGDEIQFLFKFTDADGNDILLDNDADDFTGGSANPSHPVPLYALKMPLEKINAGDFSFVDLWSFKIKSIKQQRGGVTILNNVINVNAREQAVLEVNVPEEGNLNVFVMTIDGNIVKRLNHGRVNSGTHYYRWNGTNNASKPVARGLYFVRVVGPGIDETRKVLCVKE